MSKLAVQRLLREQQKMQKNPNKSFIIIPLSENIFEWHFVLHNFENSVYTGGQYHGKLLIPAEYPMKPPTLIFVTPQGRFKPGDKICLSFTSFHPESWSTSWTIESMLIALVSFMHTNEQTAGGINTSDLDKKRLAKQSISFNLGNHQFSKIFHSHYEELGLNQQQSYTTAQQNEVSNDQFIVPKILNQQDDDQAINFKKLIIFFAIAMVLAFCYIYSKNNNMDL